MQKIVKIYHAFDQFLLSKVQDGYLWLLDRTGIYVATLMFTSFGIGIGISERTVLGGVFLAIIGLVSLFPYYLQDKGKNETYNAFAMIAEAGYFRHFFLGLQYMFLLSNLISLSGLS